MALTLVFGLAAALVAGLVYAPVRRRRHRRALAEQPFPDHWRRWLRNHWRLYARLPAHVRFRLQKQIQVMMPNTRFYGCNGLIVTEKMRLLTLAQAALLYENASQDPLAGFPAVLLYPGAFVRNDEFPDELGLVSRERRILQGESWEQGRVILSWHDIEQGLVHLNGHNLVIHEYAHQIDGGDGAMNGAPLLPHESAFRQWVAVTESAYKDLCRQVSLGTAEIDAYATTNSAEFFAVVSEYFFTAPEVLHHCYPDVYALFARFYRQDPLQWLGEFSPARTAAQ